jgi:hypothetical protein
LGSRRLASLKRDDVVAYIKHRQTQGIVNARGERRKDVSNAEINGEFATVETLILTRDEERAHDAGRHSMLADDNVRQGFFEREQYVAVQPHLPDDIQPVIEFGYLTGCPQTVAMALTGTSTRRTACSAATTSSQRLTSRTQRADSTKSRRCSARADNLDV